MKMKMFLGCLAFRLLNAAVVSTFFDPDEFWQGPEVAHKIVFGYGHLTWEWAAQLRSVLHPLILSLPYWPMKFLSMDSPVAVGLAPRAVQGCLAAVADVSVYHVAKRKYGVDVARFSLACQLTCWFNFYCLIRTYSSSMEACLTIAVFALWPSLVEPKLVSECPSFSRSLAIVLIGFCAVMRPSSALLWIPLGLLQILRNPRRQGLIVREIVPLACIVLGSSLLADRSFYGKWVFPPWNFIRMNQFEGISDLYGTHPWHWYFTQGIPAMLGPLVPLLLAGVSSSHGHIGVAGWSFWYIICHSFVGHKEFRFIQPALLLAMPNCGLGAWKLRVWATAKPKSDDQTQFPRKGPPFSSVKKHEQLVWITAACLVCVVNASCALYFSTVHQRGSIASVRYLRNLPDHTAEGVLFLMPCHSMPLYSFLHKDWPMRFLDCSPPGWSLEVAKLNAKLGSAAPVATVEKQLREHETMITEQDIFLSNSTQWLEDYLMKGAPSHIVGCEAVMTDAARVLKNHSYFENYTVFNSHIDTYGWACQSVHIYIHQPKF